MIAFLDAIMPVGLAALIMSGSLWSFAAPKFSMVQSFASFCMMTGSSIVSTYAAVHLLVTIAQLSKQF